MKHRQKLKMAKITSAIVGRPYALGRWDCLRVIAYCCRRWKVPFPDAFEGYTLDNYAARYAEDRSAAMAAFARMLSGLGTEIPPEKAGAGDFLFCSGGMIGVHAGQDCILTAFYGSAGVRVVPLQGHRVLQAWRWRKEVC